MKTNCIHLVARSWNELWVTNTK